MIKTQVLVIGGGFAGVTVSQKLQKSGINTILLDRKDYFEVTYAVLRDAADPQVNQGKGRKRYEDFIFGHFIQGSVVALQKERAVLASGEEIQFEQVVVATGSQYPSLSMAKSIDATTMSDRQQELEGYHQALKQANSVLILGGGIVGVELAGEIAYALPHLTVTLAHNGPTLLPGFKVKAQQKALAQLQNLAVKVKLNSQFQPIAPQCYRDKNSSETVDADVLLMATGTKPNNDFLTQHFAHVLNEQGLIKVSDDLSVIGEKNMFALGDIADVGEGKLGYLAANQGEYLAKTIAKQRQGKRTKAYKRNPFMSLVPTGQETGVVQLPFMVTSWKGLVGMKQKDLFISKTYKGFGQ